MVIHSDTATNETIPLATLRLEIFAEGVYSDEDADFELEKAEAVLAEIEELIKAFIRLPNNFRLVTNSQTKDLT